MKMLELREILRLVDQSTLEVLEVNDEKIRLVIKKGDTFLTHNQPVSFNNQFYLTSEPHIQLNPDDELIEDTIEIQLIHSQFIGNFVPFLKEGDFFEENALIARCKVARLNIHHELISNLSGEIVEVLADEGDLIDYGQPLYKISVEKGAY